MIPLISCICVTQKKPMMLDLVIACFEAQTYQNKQLIILFEDHDQDTIDYLEKKTFVDNIKLIKISCNPKKTLGELRNLAIEQADGEFICQWDDDDWYHINRLQYQFDALLKAKCFGSILRHWLIFDKTKNKLYISHARNWEGSILCHKKLFLLRKYDEKSKGEDTAVIEYFYENGYIINIDEITGMYIYVYHGGNTWDLEHFNEIFASSKELILEPNLTEKILKISPIETSNLIDKLLMLNSKKTETLFINSVIDEKQH